MLLRKSNSMTKKSKSKSQYRPSNHFALPHVVLDHPDFLNMKWASQALLIHIGRQYNGFNNGDLSIPISIMKIRGWSASTLNDAKKELIKNNWICETRKGGKYYTCTLYAITWIPLDKCKDKLDIKPQDFNLRVFKKNE
jgi:hypothetical protein